MTSHRRVTDTDTALALGSGELPVLGTPRLIAWLEAATVEAAAQFLTAGQTSVGAAIRVEHRRATPVGGTVIVTATAPLEAEGRRLTFSVQAHDAPGHLIAHGEIDRVIVDTDQFLATIATR